MKDTYGNAKKMARQGGKMVIYESQILGLTLYMNVAKEEILSSKIQGVNSIDYSNLSFCFTLYLFVLLCHKKNFQTKVSKKRNKIETIWVF